VLRRRRGCAVYLRLAREIVTIIFPVQNLAYLYEFRRECNAIYEVFMVPASVEFAVFEVVAPNLFMICSSGQGLRSFFQDGRMD
jgi:hypothetical protein